MIKITYSWRGDWSVYLNGRWVGALVQYTHGAWRVVSIPAQPFDLDAPITTEHVTWRDTFNEARAFAREHFAA